MTRKACYESVGRFTISNSFQFKIVENGKTLPKGNIGEVVVKSPLGMINYLHEKDQPPIEWVSLFNMKFLSHKFMLLLSVFKSSI